MRCSHTLTSNLCERDARERVEMVQEQCKARCCCRRSCAHADPLRVMRAVRFATRFGFSPDPAIMEAASSQEVRQSRVVAGD